MNNAHGPLTPLFPTEGCSSPTTTQSPSSYLSPTDSYREIAVKQHDDGHGNHGLAARWDPTGWNNDTPPEARSRSQRSSPLSTTTGSAQSPDVSRRSSATTQNEDKRGGEDHDGWLLLTEELTPTRSPKPLNQHTQKERENDRKMNEEELEERRDDKAGDDGQEVEGEQEYESKQKAGDDMRGEDVQKGENDNVGMELERGEADSQIESPEADDSQPLTPKPLANESSESQDESPRIHIHTIQQQNLTGMSNIQPSPNPIETFLDDWSDEEMDSARLEKERRKLKRSRVDLVSFRSYLRVKHEELKIKESKKADADNEFMNFVRENIATPLTLLDDPLQNSGTLRQNLDFHFQAMQSVRDEYGPLEDEYNELLVRLDDMEYELARTEGRVYSRGVSKSAVSDSTTTSGGHSSYSETALWGSWSDEKPYEPLHLEYLSRLGDLDLALERLAHMNEEFDALTIDQETKAHFGLEFDKNLKTFLDDLPSMQARLESDIVNIQNDVKRLRGQCIEAGIEIEFDDDESSTANSTSQVLEESDARDDGKSILQEKQRPHIPEKHCMFTLLSPFPDTETLCSLQHLITKFDENNKSDRINRWLLYSLRTSKLDAFRFAQYYLDFFAFSNCQTDTAQWELQWQQSVLSTWSTDGANKPSSAFRHGFTQSYGSCSILPIAEGRKLRLDSPKP